MKLRRAYLWRGRRKSTNVEDAPPVMPRGGAGGPVLLYPFHGDLRYRALVAFTTGRYEQSAPGRARRPIYVYTMPDGAVIEGVLHAKYPSIGGLWAPETETPGQALGPELQEKKED